MTTEGTGGEDMTSDGTAREEGSMSVAEGAEVFAETQTGSQKVVQMERVIDVPLAVTMRFGQRQMALRELLDLSTGSLLELDRQVEEPVDLMLGDRVIARGEVVIVDGHYGMRVTEVLENPARRAGRERPQPLSYAAL